MKSTGERLIPGDSGEVELEHLNRYYFVREELDLKDKIIVDLASGEGYGSALLADTAKYVYGIDISAEAVEHARNKYVKSNLEYVQGDATKIPLADHFADIFVSFETIEHHDRHVEMMQEIKRVLKVDGILIISSPDKYYYSDLVNFKNDYHVKELYYDEFKKLINSYFTNTCYFTQRTFSGSVIMLDDVNKSYKKPVVIETGGRSYELTPLYNVAVATNDINYTPKLPMVFYKEKGNMITLSDIDDAKNSVRKSWPYRIGNTIIKPLKALKSLMY
jgi:SAM-dependent methyltransferase